MDIYKVSCSDGNFIGIEDEKYFLKKDKAEELYNDTIKLIKRQCGLSGTKDRVKNFNGYKQTIIYVLTFSGMETTIEVFMEQIKVEE